MANNTEPAFRGEKAFLSNFYSAPILMYGKEYPNVEQAFVAAKSLDPAIREFIRNMPTAGQAKRYGKTIQVREDWDKVKLEVMETLLRRKFAIPHLKAMLLATGDEPIIEHNPWHDYFWGVCDGKGENHLGKLLMKIREEIRKSEKITFDLEETINDGYPTLQST